MRRILKNLLKLLSFLIKNHLTPKIIMGQKVFSSSPYDKPSNFLIKTQNNLYKQLNKETIIKLEF